MAVIIHQNVVLKTILSLSPLLSFSLSVLSLSYTTYQTQTTKNKTFVETAIYQGHI